MHSAYSSELVNPFDPIPWTFVIRAEHFMRYAFAREYLRKKPRLSSVIYDVACGDGYGTKLLSVIAGKVYGYEISQDYLARANKENKAENAEFISVDLNTLTFDLFIKEYNVTSPTAIVCFETLEHVDHPDKLMRDFFTLLPKDGVVIYSVPHEVYERKKDGKPLNKFHKHLFSEKDVLCLAIDAGFTVMDVLGQPLPHILLRQLKPILKKIDAYSLTSQERFKFVSKIFASPTRLFTQYSYSYLVIAQKGS